MLRTQNDSQSKHLTGAPAVAGGGGGAGRQATLDARQADERFQSSQVENTGAVIRLADTPHPKTTQPFGLEQPPLALANTE